MKCGMWVLKLRKKLETTGFDTVTQAQNYLKSINKKLKLWEEQIFRKQVKKKLINSLPSIIIK